MKQMKALADEFRLAQSIASTAMTSSADADKFVRSKMRSFAIRHLFKSLPNDVPRYDLRGDRPSGLQSAVQALARLQELPQRVAQASFRVDVQLVEGPDRRRRTFGRVEVQAAAAFGHLRLRREDGENGLRRLAPGTPRSMRFVEALLRTYNISCFRGFFDYTCTALAGRVRELHIVIDFKDGNDEYVQSMYRPDPLFFPHPRGARSLVLVLLPGSGKHARGSTRPTVRELEHAGVADIDDEERDTRNPEGMPTERHFPFHDVPGGPVARGVICATVGRSARSGGTWRVSRT